MGFKSLDLVKTEHALYLLQQTLFVIHIALI